MNTTKQRIQKSEPINKW